MVMSRHLACSLFLLIGGCLITQDDVDQWTANDEDNEEELDTAGGGSGADDGSSGTDTGFTGGSGSDGTPVSVRGTTGPIPNVTMSEFTASVPGNGSSFTDAEASTTQMPRSR